MINNFIATLLLTTCIGASNSYQPYIYTYSNDYTFLLPISEADTFGESFGYLQTFKYDYESQSFKEYSIYKLTNSLGYQPTIASNYSGMLSASNSGVNTLSDMDMILYISGNSIGNNQLTLFSSYVFGYKYQGFYTQPSLNLINNTAFTTYDQYASMFANNRTYFTGAYDTIHQYNFSSTYVTLTSFTPQISGDDYSISFHLEYMFDTANNTAYEMGYNDGYAQGYQDGDNDGYSSGYEEGQEFGYNTGWHVGYNAGKNAYSGDDLEFNLVSLLGGIADTPVRVIVQLFNFDFFGMSALTIFMSLLTGILVLHFIRKIWR